MVQKDPLHSYPVEQAGMHIQIDLASDSTTATTIANKV